MKKKVIIKNVNGFYNGTKNFVVIPVDDATRKVLKEFCDVPDTDELLFSVSRFAAIDAVGDVGVDSFIDGVGTATLSVKLEPTEYDWTYKGKKGNTKKWQVCGLFFKSPLVDNNLEGLYDD